jgi:hypothetical protein
MSAILQDAARDFRRAQSGKRMHQSGGKPGQKQVGDNAANRGRIGPATCTPTPRLQGRPRGGSRDVDRSRAASGPSQPRDAGREHGWMRHRNVYNVSPLKCGPSRGLGGQPSFGCVRSSPHWPPQQTVVVSRGWALNPGRCRTVNEASHVGDSVKGARPS